MLNSVTLGLQARISSCRPPPFPDPPPSSWREVFVFQRVCRLTSLVVRGTCRLPQIRFKFALSTGCTVRVVLLVVTRCLSMPPLPLVTRVWRFTRTLCTNDCERCMRAMVLLEVRR